MIEQRILATELPVGALLALYESVGWTSYTKEPETLVKAIANSTYVVSLWDDEELIGLARCISDDVSICYLQDILLKPGYQGKGLGRQLLESCLSRFEHVRQRVLLTDDREQQKQFYKALGFHNTRELKVHVLNAFVQYKNVNLE